MFLKRVFVITNMQKVTLLNKRQKLSLSRSHKIKRVQLCIKPAASLLGRLCRNALYAALLQVLCRKVVWMCGYAAGYAGYGMQQASYVQCAAAALTSSFVWWHGLASMLKCRIFLLLKYSEKALRIQFSSPQ